MTALLGSLGSIPSLPGALCRDRHELFDLPAGTSADYEVVAAEALALCRQCPALAGCRVWFDGLSPKQRPAGVIAGQVHQWKDRDR
ncbi:hypothetical protein C3469_04340 [Mycobacterium kansasii]|uniref:hypothetical protein n=1 Tax=Mycobacterium kansasii TaxID=1768 RepID=UPI000CDD94A0|nr:hypothetical protein [Mycobacterium kansasii]POY04856.1 hypothetical protein C3479_00170 [Mycobacterium kansasii]POY29165.1 hypothetical protein C3469_04340 [Mycobacterium kansasii]POY34238.1 hypothetical protein C3478_02260 [Mycobacterium kansasii]